MQLPLQITYRHTDASPTLDDYIRERVDKLDRMFDKLTSCRVVVESPHQHHNKGKIYHVRIDLTAPETELVVSRDPAQHQAHQDVYVAVRDAFDAAQRKLETYIEQRRGQTKTHEIPPYGRISELVPAQDYGRIRTPDEREIYFHRNSLIDANLDDLEIGAEVRFVEEQGENGPQASTVHVVGKHHLVG
ncbi:MAG: 30S ribosomal protein S30 [Gammaproteobacteria bacterium SG8_47]|nr:MAG: 30S ribosomal protein S30 [Gammaproteobacteria bacterium SG8_47]